MAIITEPYQKVMDEVWQTIIDACEAYFLRHETTFAGDSRAPEFTDEQVERQVKHWDGYRHDPGALNWGGAQNSSRPYAYDFTKLPTSWQRALCERAYVICDEGGLFKDEAYMRTIKERRRNLS